MSGVSLGVNVVQCTTRCAVRLVFAREETPVLGVTEVSRGPGGWDAVPSQGVAPIGFEPMTFGL